MPTFVNKHLRKLSSAVTTLISSSDVDAASLVRDSTFYFEDGNVALVADRIVFRVHRGVLGRHSTILRDYFALLTQADQLESYDGCLVVRMSGSSNELHFFLTTLYDHVKVHVDDLYQVIQLLQIALKYRLDGVRGFAIQALSEAYPTTLVAYDLFVGTRPSCAEVIILAHETQQEQFLPSAYYELCRYPINEIINLNLSQYDLDVFLLGRDRLANHVSTLVLNRFQDNGQPHVECADQWTEFTAASQKILSNPGFSAGFCPLSLLASIIDLPCVDDMCRKCRQHIRILILKEKESIWTSLPEVFDLGSWEELKGDHSR